jgi:hypothetical protein
MEKESFVTSYTGFHCIPTSATNLFLSVLIVISSNCNGQKLHTIERDVGSLLQGTHLYGRDSKLGNA